MMKTLLLILMTMLGLDMKQEPIAVDGKEWYVKRQVPYIDDRYTSIVHMWIEGDTIVDDLVCKKLYTHTQELWGEKRDTLTVGYCRQDGDKYYQNGELMFDFGLQVGDVFVPEKGRPLKVSSVGDTILMDGLKRKCLLMVEDRDVDISSYNGDYWVEGLGSLRMGIYTNDFTSVGVIKTLNRCVYNKDERNHVTIMKSPDFN